MRSVRSVCIHLAAILMIPAVCNAEACDAPAEAYQLVRQFAERSGAPGISVSVGLDAELAWSAGFGFADLEQGVRVDPAGTKFRVGSTAKPMTALALLTLVEGGRIDLDEDVRRFVPSFPRKEHPFTVRQLAGHLAGIRHYQGDEAYLRQHYGNVADSLALFENDPLVEAPGQRWSYSSYGYNLLSAVIEAASRKPFLEYMQEAVFEPLGMTGTVPDDLAEIVPQRGRYYRREDGTVYNEPEVDNSHKWASGGFLSTTDDLAKFGLAHLKDDLVSTEIRERLWTEQHTTSGETTGYGLGWRIVDDSDGGEWIGHGGGSIGGTTQLWLFPEHGLVLAMASNLTETDYEDVLPKLRAIFLAQSACGATASEPNSH